MLRSVPLAAILFVPSLLAQAPPNYYATVNASTPSTLRATLHAVIDGHTRFPYTSSGTDTWIILELADQDPTNSANVVDLYRNASYLKIGGGVGVYDREHSWPKSYGFPNDVSTNYPYTDCHQLFLCDSGYNTARSNKVYATTSAAATEFATLLTNGRGGGSGTYPGNSNWTDSVAGGRWETWHDRRGDVARALMYLDVRYEGGNHPVTNVVEPDLILTDNLSLINASNTGNNELVAYMGLLSTLLQWHAADPVDQNEMDRNDQVFAFQGNRNPFVDHPEWVACLFSAQCGGDVTPPAAPTGLRAVFQRKSVRLAWAANTEPDLAGYRVFRAPSAGGVYTQLNVSLVTTTSFKDAAVLPGIDYHYVVRAVDTTGNVSAPSGELPLWPPAPQLDEAPASGSVWINELHYDNVGADTGEFVEVAGPAGTNLSGWTLLGYNGNGGAVYQTITLTGTIPNQQNGYGTLSFAFTGLQNGSPDGIALVNGSSQAVEFLAYEGSFTAVGGAANGMTPSLIPTSESDTTPIGFSLQRQGAGHEPTSFTWSAPIAATPGLVNAGQTLQ